MRVRVDGALASLFPAAGRVYDARHYGEKNMKVALAVLLAAALALTWALVTETTENGQLHRQVTELTAKLGDKTARDNLELKEKCALQAERMFRILGFDGSYVSHYNSTLNKCLMTVDTGTVRPLRITKFLYDAYERREYASYQQTGNVQNPPEDCNLKPPGEKPMYCNSSQEYEAFIARYMD